MDPARFLQEYEVFRSLLAKDLNYWSKTGTSISYVGGNVGIWTTSPESSLEVRGDYVASKGQIYINANAGQSGYFGLNADANRGAGFFFDSAGSPTMWLYRPASTTDLRIYDDTTNNDDIVTFKAGGNVGIGTTAPGAKLDVVGSTYPVLGITRTSTAANSALATALYKMQTTADMTDGAGVGVAFAIQDSSGVSNDIGFFGAVRNGADNTSRMEFRPYNAGSQVTAMVLDNLGNVGIGTTTPTSTLTLIGGMAIGSNINAGANNLFVSGNCSALTFTDRTPFYRGDAIKEIYNIKESGTTIDHLTLPEFARKEFKKDIYEKQETIDEDGQTIINEVKVGEEIEYGRDLGAMISVLTVGIQQLTDRLEKIEKIVI